MDNRTLEKIKEIEKYLEELSSIFPLNFEQYKTDFKVKAICERYFEKIIEAVIDLAFFVIKEKNLKIPEEDRQAFNILEKEEIISKQLAERLSDAKGMRNIIAHEYGKIDNEIVFEAITTELERDVKEFILMIKEKIKEKKHL